MFEPAAPRQRVGFIGLGTMGKPMAEALIRGGFQLYVAPHRDNTPALALASLGASVLADPAAVANASDVVVTMVPDTPDVEDAILGPRGVINGAHDALIVVDMSTVPPMTTRRVGEHLAHRGVRMVDAPVSGGPARAAKGDLSIMVGGDDGTVAEVRPVLAAMGSRITHLGALGMGQVAKLAHNVLLGGIIVANIEALTFGVKGGIPAATLRDVFLAGTAANWNLEHSLANSVLKGVYDPPAFALRLMHKDLTAALAAARDMGVPMLESALVHQVFTLALGEGAGDLDFSAIARIYERSARVRIAGGTGAPPSATGGH